MNFQGDHCLHQCGHLGCRVGEASSNPGPVQTRQARRHRHDQVIADTAQDSVSTTRSRSRFCDRCLGRGTVIQIWTNQCAGQVTGHVLEFSMNGVTSKSKVSCWCVWAPDEAVYGSWSTLSEVRSWAAVDNSMWAQFAKQLGDDWTMSRCWLNFNLQTSRREPRLRAPSCDWCTPWHG